MVDKNEAFGLHDYRRLQVIMGVNVKIKGIEQTMIISAYQAAVARFVFHRLGLSGE